MAPWVVFAEQRTRGDGDLAVVSAAPNAEAEVLFATPFHEAEPEVSPNGRWLAHASDESGKFEIYVRPLRHEGGRQLSPPASNSLS